MNGMRRVKKQVSTGFVNILRTVDDFGTKELVSEEQFKTVWEWITPEEYKARKLSTRARKDAWSAAVKSAVNDYHAEIAANVNANNALLARLQRGST